MKTCITITAAAVVFGAALASVPAFAQQAHPHYGKSVDDGGMIDEPPAPARKPLYNSAAAPSTQHYGKGLDDGGLVDPPSAKDMSAAKAVSTAVAKQKPAAAHYGKGVDDGGLVN
jgi:hypothetical protein